MFDFGRNMISPALAAAAVTSMLMLAAPFVPATLRSGSQEHFEELAEWVLRTGNLTVVRRTVAHRLGLADADIVVRQRAFRPAGAQLTEVIAVVPPIGAEERIVFVARIDEDDGSCVVWRTSSDGRLRITATFGETAGSPSRPAVEGDFDSVKKYLFDRLRIEVNAAKPPS